jgi:WD40 repeat protein
MCQGGGQPAQIKPTPQSGSRALARVDEHDDPLPQQAIARMGTSRLKHGSLAIHVAFSANGKILASAGRDNLVRLWDPGTGKEIKQIAGHESWVYCVAFSPDAKQLASSSRDKTIRVWDVATGKQLRQLTGHQQKIPSIAFSADGKTLASTSADNTLRLWDVEKAQQLHELPGAAAHGTSCTAFSPDGKFVASSSLDLAIRLWEVATGKEALQFVGHTVDLESLDFSRDGKRLASGSPDETIRIWDVASAGLIRIIKPKGKVWTVRYSPDDKVIASGGPDRVLHMWDASTGKEIRRMLGHAAGVSEVAFAPDGKTIASAGHDHTVRIWDVQTGKPRFPFSGHAGAVVALAVSPDGKRIATGGSDGVLILWDRDSARELMRSSCLQSCITAVAFSPDGKRIAAAGCHDGRQSRDAVQQVGIAIVDLAKAEVVKRLPITATRVLDLRFSDGARKLKAASDDGNEGVLHTWDTETSKQLSSVTLGQSNSRMVAAFSQDGRKLALGDNGLVRLFNGASGQEYSIGPFSNNGSPTAIAFSADGRTLAVACNDRNIYLWEVNTGQQRATISLDQQFASAIAFSPNGRTLAFAGISNPPDGWHLLYSEAAVDPCIHFHDLARISPNERVTGHAGPINALIFARDGRFLWSGSNDSTAIKWSVDDFAKTAAREQLNKADLNGLWADLRSDDAAKAFQSGWRLANAGNAGTFIRDHLKAASKLVDGDRIATLRALEVLEHTRDPEAQRMIEQLARVAANDSVTQAAKETLERMRGREAHSP